MFPLIYGILAQQGGIEFLLFDTFTTDDAAPVTSPRTCEPGPGTLTLTDTGNKLSISGGSLVIAGATSGLADPRVKGTDDFRVPGKVLYARIKGGTFELGYANLSSNTMRGGVFAFAGTSSIYVYDVPTYVGPIAAWVASTWYELAIIQKDISALVAVKGGAWANWTLLHVGNYRFSSTESDGSHYKQHINHTVNSSGEISEMFERELGGIWGKSSTFAELVENNTAANPYSGTMSSAAMLVELEWTITSSEVMEIKVRYTDDNNCWIARCDQATSTMKLIQKQAGSETERASASGMGFTAGETRPLFVRCEGNAIIYGNNAYKNGYSSASFNNTVTGVKISSTVSGGVKRVRAYPLALPVGFDPATMASGSAPINIFLVGDSKTNGSTFDAPLAFAIEEEHNIGAYCSRPDKIGIGGAGVATIDTNMATYLSTRNHVPTYILVNLGVNDYDTQVEATWKANYTSILDKLNAKWPSARIYCMKTWRQGYDTQANTQAGWLDAVIATRSSFAFAGPDERDWLKGGDNGATMTTDGIHYSAAGQAEALLQWKAAIGY